MRTPNYLTLEQKHSFVQLILASESTMAETCRAFRISRQTGYKWLDRYRQSGLMGLMVQSRRPHHCARATSAVWVERLRLARRRRKRWGKSSAPGYKARILALAFLPPAPWAGSCVGMAGHVRRCGAGAGLTGLGRPFAKPPGPTKFGRLISKVTFIQPTASGVIR